jgi:hypothetical protein
VRLARERGAQLANLIHTFFDELTSPNSAHRELALLAMSEFIDTNELKAFLDQSFEPPKIPPPQVGSKVPPLGL